MILSGGGAGTAGLDTDAAGTKWKLSPPEPIRTVPERQLLLRMGMRAFAMRMWAFSGRIRTVALWTRCTLMRIRPCWNGVCH